MFFSVVCLLLSTGAPCDAPEYFGLCDPYVPGIITRLRDYQTIPVRDTWPGGPAEKAGVCPGDIVLAVNGVLAERNSADRMLREIVQAQPNPLLLRIRSGTREREVRVIPVRESVLAGLSGRRFIRKKAVPLGQELAGVLQVDEFREAVGARLKLVRFDEGLWFPATTERERVGTLMESLRRFRESRRLYRILPAYTDKDQPSAGFSLALIDSPPDAYIIQVLPGSPADQAGLQPGDRVLSLDHLRVSSTADLERAEAVFAEKRSGVLQVGVLRDDAELTVNLTPLAATFFNGSKIDPVTGEPTSLRGLPQREGPASPLSLIVGLRLLFDQDTGRAVVEDVEYPSPAFDSGIQIGDILVDINGRDIGTLTEQTLQEVLSPDAASEIHLKVRRKANEKIVRIVPEPWAAVLAKIGRGVCNQRPTPLFCCDPGR